VQPAIQAVGLEREFKGGVKAVAGIDIEVAAGEVYGFLGPNGAGKTTTVRMLVTLLRPTGGSARVAGFDVATQAADVRRQIGVALQEAALDPLMTGRELIELQATLHGIPPRRVAARGQELIERVGLVDAQDRRVGTYSGGMRRRLDLAMALIHSPSVLFLDEPTTGLDPRSRRTMWDSIRDLVAEGVTILLTTQYLDEADHLADRIAVLDQGRIVAEGTPDELKRRIPGGHVELHFATSEALSAAVGLVDAASRDDERLVIQVPGDGGVASLRRLLDQLDDGDVEVEHLSIHTPDLDDVFFAVTGHSAAEQAA
jgi:ABC-2 type transport system ATP-binding protein